jgi:hypothetical protein
MNQNSESLILDEIIYTQARTTAEAENCKCIDYTKHNYCDKDKRLQDIEINKKRLTKEYITYSATQMIKNAQKVK